MPKEVPNSQSPDATYVLGILAEGAKPVLAETVVLEFLRHEVATRPDIEVSLRGIQLDEGTDSWLQPALRSPRGGFVRFLFSYDRWLECSVSPRMVPGFTVHRGIHWRDDLAPRTGTLRECAVALSESTKLGGEFEACRQAWKADSVDTKGMAAVREGDEVSIVEGCHRLIGLAWLLSAEPEFRLSRDIPLYLGLSRRATG